MDEQNVPLFVLPMTLFPGEIQELRIFEPRYRQMLDRCLLDEVPFGLVQNDPFQPIVGWDGPRQHGCEAMIIHHETRGVNHFITIQGGRRFRIRETIPPALPPLSDPQFDDLTQEGFLPDLDSILERIPEGSSSQSLYISANVTFCDELPRLQEELVEELKEMVSTIVEGAQFPFQMDDDAREALASQIIDQYVSDDSNSLYHVASLVTTNLEQRQQILACSTIEEIIEELRWHYSHPEDEVEN